MNKTTLAVAIAAMVASAHSAQAREHHSRHIRHHIVRSRAVAQPQWGWLPGAQFAWQSQPYTAPQAFGFSAPSFAAYPRHRGHRAYGADRVRTAYRERSYFDHVAYSGRDRVAYSGRDRRPAAWCGWEMRRLVGADPGPSYNLARNWAHWGHSGPAGVGAVVVWRHHVGKIVGQENGQWVIESGNDGHALRTRARSIGGAIAVRWG